MAKRQAKRRRRARRPAGAGWEQRIPARRVVGTELTRGTRWEYRAVVEGEPRPWASTLRKALADLAPRLVHVPWPKRWVAFGVAEEGRFVEFSPPSGVPKTLTVAGRKLRRVVVEPDSHGRIDLPHWFGPYKQDRTVYLFGEFELPAACEVTVHAGADWLMEWWIDGRATYDTLATGNRSPVGGRAHAFTLTLSAGRHVAAVRVVSGSGGWMIASEATRVAAPAREAGKRFHVEARRVFRVPAPGRFAGLTFVGRGDDRPKLNGRAVPVPLAGMRYKVVPGVPAPLLRKGRNELAWRWREEQSARGAQVVGLKNFEASGENAGLIVEGRVYGLAADDARIQTGPLLNCVEPEAFTLTCRTNLRVPVALTADGHELRSKPGLIHRFRMSGLAPDREYRYRIAPVAGGKPLKRRARRGRVRTLPSGGEFSFIMVGDVYPFDDTWERVSRAIAAERPSLVVFSGDMLLDGRSDEQWDRCFFHRAEELLASVPFYAVIGNHEQDCPLFDRIFLTPGGRHWSQRIGPLLLVGVDGRAGLEDAAALLEWLRGVLDGSDAKYIFVFSHYPAWSSAGHGRLGPDGRPIEAAVRFAKEAVLPLLREHGATAYVNGHDHCYERSELPGGEAGGITTITSAGAGSRLYRKARQSGEQNPHSKVFVSAHHYCRVHVTDTACEMTVVDLAGAVLDRRVWRPR